MRPRPAFVYVLEITAAHSNMSGGTSMGEWYNVKLVNGKLPGSHRRSVNFSVPEFFRNLYKLRDLRRADHSDGGASHHPSV